LRISVGIKEVFGSYWLYANRLGRRRAVKLTDSAAHAPLRVDGNPSGVVDPDRRSAERTFVDTKPACFACAPDTDGLVNPGQPDANLGDFCDQPQRPARTRLHAGQF